MRLAGTLGLWIVVGAALAAADFWDEKDFTTWSDKEVEKMLSDSPWSRKVTIAIRGQGDRGSSDLFGGAGGGGGRSGGRDSFDVGARSSRMRLTVTWRSALPVKQATVRRKAGLDVPIPSADQQFLARHEPQYVVSVSGFPKQFARLAQDPAVRTETVLERKNMDPISPDDIRIFRDGDSVMVMYFFPRTNAIALGDKDVEFVTTLAQTEVKKKFKLEDMVFAGQLAL